MHILFYLFAGVILLVILLLGYIAWIGFSISKEKQRARETLAALLCPSCNQQLGRDVVCNAETEVERRVAELWKKSPGMKLRLAEMLWPVECLKCKWRGEFSQKTLELRS